MKRFLIAIGLILLATPAFSQSVQQSGVITPNHVPRWVSSGVIGDGGTAADSPITSFGVTSNTTAGICVSSGRSTAAGRQQLCLGAPLASSAVISLQNYGTATAQGLSFDINGTIVTLPSTGGDFITGTGPYAAGGIPCFTGTTAAVTDCGLVSIAHGGTGAATAAAARTALGLGTLALQDATGIAVTGGSITGMPAPTNGSDVATKTYVDATSSGLNIVAASSLATAAVLPNTPTYSNGASGVGATLTAGSNTALTVDGTAAPLNTVVLVKNQASTFQNGIYTVTTAGGGVPWVLTRATYFDTPGEMLSGSYTFITGGSTNVGIAYTLQTTVAAVGTDPATFVQFSTGTTGTVTSATIAAGTGLAVSGTCTIITNGTCTVGLSAPVSPTNGGTGVNNGSSTLTLAANLIQSGAFATTLTSSGVTNAILPSGTHVLAGLDVANVFSVQQRINSNLVIAGDQGLTIGATGFVSIEKLSVTYNGTNNFGMYINESTNTGTANYIVFGNIGTVVGSITQNGSAAISYNTTSDGRLKNIIGPIHDATAVIAGLKTYDFTWKKNGEHSRGFIAQEAVNVIPEAVHVGGDDPDKEPWQVDYSKAVPVLWAGAREMNDRIIALEQQVIDMRTRLKMREVRFP